MKEVELPDGSIAEFPDSMSDADIVRVLKNEVMRNPELRAAPSKEESPNPVVNFLAGAVKGASNIGATLLTPLDWAARKAGIQNDFIGRNDRREASTGALTTMGANPDATSFKLGEFGAEIAGTAGVPGAMGRAASLVPRIAQTGIPAALSSGGLSLGGAGGWNVPGAATRIGAGALTGGAMSGLVNPDDAGVGSIIGGAIPIAGKLGGEAGRYVGNKLSSASEKLMRSALKPVVSAQRSGDADIAARTMLDEGLNATKSGMAKLRSRIDDLNTKIADEISGSNAMIDKANVLGTLDDTRNFFTKQVAPGTDLSAIDTVGKNFVDHPAFPPVQRFIPVQDAQEMKQGTYKILSKKYGQLGSTETEAQKALARGLKDEISSAVPGVAELNAKESKLIKTLNVAERRVLAEMNNNPMGLSLISHNPWTWAAFLADRSSAFKSIAARMANAASENVGQRSGLLNLIENPVVRSGLLLSQESP